MIPMAGAGRCSVPSAPRGSLRLVPRRIGARSAAWSGACDGDTSSATPSAPDHCPELNLLIDDNGFGQLTHGRSSAMAALGSEVMMSGGGVCSGVVGTGGRSLASIGLRGRLGWAD